MPKLLVPGVKVPPEKPEEVLLDGALRIEARYASRVEALVRGAAVPEIPVDAADDDVVEIELEGGVREWTSVAQLRADLEERGIASPDRSAAPPPDGAVRIPVILPRGPQTRSAGGWILKGLQILHISPSDALANLAAKAIVAKFEDKRPTASGVYPCPDTFTLDPGKKLKPGDVAADGKLLLFLHGTASSTQGSFGKLAGTQEWKDLRREYGSRIFALEHHTLSVSPLRNAIDLLEVLPMGAALHMVSHSRGGLIGELLCRGAIAESDLAPFAKRPEDLELFRRLGELLRDKRPRIERFVRVACPARGTLLASRRLDRYLSVILNVFRLIPAFRTTPLDLLYDILRATLLTLAKKRTDPKELPGLEAMMPESPVIHLLNQASTTNDELGVIAGDIQGQGVWGRLKVFATDVFYREDHDLVVNTSSMYGGAAREKVSVFFDKGPEVNHFSYFGNESSRNRLHAWLVRSAGERGGLFTEVRPEPVREVRGESLREEDRREVAFLVPDFLGSQLGDDRGWIWPDLKALAHGGLVRLVMDRRVDVGTLVPQPYADLVTLLSHQVRIVPLPYDWRASVLDSAERIAAEVEGELGRHDRQVSFLAHGLGGLVVRALIARKTELWGRIRERGGHLVMLGTPSHGTLFAARLLLGEETLLRELDLLDIGHELADLTALFAGFPSVLEMLPEGGEIDLFDPASWARMAQACPTLGTPAPQALAAARNARGELDALLKHAGTGGLLYVAGSAPWTPARLAWRGAAADGEPVFEGTREGDGRVPHALGRLAGVPTWYANAPHGSLVRDGSLFAALLELLQRGETRLLPTRPPESATPELLPPPAPEPLLFPDQDDLLAAAFGYSTAAPTVAELLALRVSVAHGDLKHARYPVAVGHYENDTIVSAEKLLDRQLNNGLSERHRLGLYPGPRGTVEVVLVSGSSPPGALVIGLGEVGRISPALVRDGVARVALRYALTVAERPAASGEASAWRSAAISTVLLGTGGGRSISVEESVAAIVEGVLQANRALRDQGFWDRVRIDGVEIVELYEAVAIQAAHAARGLAGQLRSQLREHERIEAAPTLRRLPGGRVRQPASWYAGGWWRRLQIQRETDHQLSFEVLTERARTEKTTLFIQPALVNHFVREASAQPAYQRQVAETLFELLLPNELKDRAQEETNLVLLLDEDTAQYPWELLTDRSPGRANEPFVTCVGVIRQLRTQQNEFRPVVRVPRDRFALVVGDPSSPLPELTSAQAEAREVAEALQAGGYAPNSLYRPIGWEIIRELYAQDYQILHLAGHGQYNAFRPEASGMVIGQGLFLTAAELGQLRAVPPFVFINCCHLGTIDPAAAAAQQFPRLAASLATQLIRMGVRALVVAGWAVEDSVARIFARRLYEALLSGQRFGQAARLARQAAYRERPEGNTWGAYQCYGDPDFTLDLRQVQESTRTDPAEYVSAREFLDEFAGLQGEVRASTDAAIWDTLLQRVDLLESALPADWRDGEMLSALAGVRGDLGDWKLAIEAYRKAIASQSARVTLRDLETLANLEVRFAGKLRKAGDASLGDYEELLNEARALLDWLLQLGETIERLSLVGSAYKRIAMIVEGDARKEALETASRMYWQAHEKSQKEQGRIDPYPALNWVACQIVLGSKEKEDLLGLINACEREGARLAEADPQFFHRLHGSDAVLHRHLIQGNLKDAEQEVVASYRRVLQAGASFKDISSVAEHLEFLREMIQKRSQEMADALLRIRHSLGVMDLPDTPSSSVTPPPPAAGGGGMEGGAQLTSSPASRTGTKRRRGRPASGRRKSPAG